MVGYNGWRTEETWQVATHIFNSEELMTRLGEYYIQQAGYVDPVDYYWGYIAFAGIELAKTSEGVLFSDSHIDTSALGCALQEAYDHSHRS